MLKPRKFLPPAPDPQISWPEPKTLNPKPLKPLNPEPGLLFSVAQAALGLRAAKAPPRGREPLPRTKPSSPGHFLLYVRVCIYIVYICMYVCKYIYARRISAASDLDSLPRNAKCEIYIYTCLGMCSSFAFWFRFA